MTQAVHPNRSKIHAQHGAAHHAAEKIAGQVDSARRSAVGGRGPADVAGRRRLREERADPDEDETADHGGQARREQRDEANAREAEGAPERRRRAYSSDDAPDQRRRDHRRQEDEIDETELHRSRHEGRLHENEIDVGERPDEGEQDAEADAERGAQPRIAQVQRPRGQLRLHRPPEAVGGRSPLHREIDEHGPGQIERREEIEVRREPEMIGYRGGDESPDEVARDVTGDVGGRSGGRVDRTRMLAEIGERQREGGRHAEPLDDAQRGENGEVGRNGEQSGRKCENDEADQDAEPLVDPPAEDRDDQAGDRHSERAGVDRGTHGGRADPVGARQRRQDGLGREQIDDGEKRGERDHQKAGDDPGGVLLRLDRRQRCDVRHRRHGVCLLNCRNGGRPAARAGRRECRGRRCGTHMFLSDLSWRRSPT